MMIVGTSHFVSLRCALSYYAEYGVGKAGVTRKIAEGEIHLGPPTLKTGETIRLVDQNRRYAVITA